MEFSFTPLGISAAQPAYGRHLAGHVLAVGNTRLLFDCGEGTQFQLYRFGIKRSQIRHIFISHLHGDHFFGLIGLLTSFGMNDRKEALHVYAPHGLKEIIQHQLEFTGTILPYDLIFHLLEVQTLEQILETKYLEVFSFPLVHRTPTFGFLVREKQIPLNIIPEVIERYGLSFEQIRAVKAGGDLKFPDGRHILNEELTLPPYARRSFAYCSDTAYSEAVVPYIRGVDILYHESTFQEEDALLAAETFHSTARQAAQIARLSEVKTLVLGHYSARYFDLSALLEEAKAVFPNSRLGEEGLGVEVQAERLK